MVKKRKELGNYKHTEEQKRKASKRLKGIPKTPEHIEKVRQAFIGKKFPKALYPKMGWRTSRKNQVFPFKDSSIEVKIQEFLTQLHVEYVTHKYISEIDHSYQCDILIPEQKGINQKTIIECDGCYFHGCEICNLKGNTKTPEQKIRDKFRTKELKEKGYRVIRLWEHEIKKMELNEFKIKLK